MKKMRRSMFLLMVMAHAGMQGSEQQPLLSNAYNPYGTVRIQINHQVGVEQGYEQELSQIISTAIKKFPDVVTDIVVSYVKRDKEGEELCRAIQKTLKYYKAAQWIGGIAWLECATEAPLGITAIATDQWQLVPHSNIEAPSLMRGIVSTALVGSAAVSFFVSLPAHKYIREGDEINQIESERWSVIWPHCNTLSLGIFTVSVAALVGSSGSLEGSAAVMLVGGVVGTMNATWLLVKSCLRSRELSRRCED